MIKKIKKGNYKGILTIPSSKSDCQRALLIAALGENLSTIYHVGKSDDEQALLTIIKTLGATVNQINDSTFQIGGGLNFNKSLTLDVKESGLAIRLLISICSLSSFKIILKGSGSLLQRSMKLIEDFLPQFDVIVKTNGGFIPLEITGPLKGNKVEIDGSISSQYISGLLIALPLTSNDSELLVSNLNSIPYVEMTINTLKKFGVQIENQNNQIYRIKGNQKIKSCDYNIEGDWSSASYWIVAAALGYSIKVKNLNLESYQADKAILSILRNSGCIFEFNTDELSVNGNNRLPLIADLTQCPDLFPALAVYCALTPGISILKGIHRLLNKESNRALAIKNEFNKLGCEISLKDDEMIIEGINKIQSTDVYSHEDHRIAMSLSILALFSDSEVIIHNAQAVSKSYPRFWKDLDYLKQTD